MNKILIAGGNGYIGSQACVVLLQKGNEVIVLDNLCNRRPEVQARIRLITGCASGFMKATTETWPC